VISGSYTEGISFFKGQGGGKYAADRKLTDKAGKPISKDYAQTPCLGDWDGDGDFDMAMGVISGPVKLYLNNGDLTFKEAGSFRVDGKPITASDGGPCVTDWDADGILDLLLGDGEGGLHFYKAAKRGTLDLTADENSVILAGPKSMEAWQPRKPDPGAPVPFSPKYPGVRTKPYAADWNGDGKLDLLVGDYLSIETPAPALTTAQKTYLSTLQARQREVSKEMQSAYLRVQAKALKASGLKSVNNLSREQMTKYSTAHRKVMLKDTSYKTLSNRYFAIYEKMSELVPRNEGTGVVWVYLRK
jgi:hypothetical protein